MAKKKAKKAAKPASGGAELQAFKAAIQNLKVAGLALAKAAKADEQLRKKGALHNAVDNLQDTTARVVKAIPTDPPTTTVSQ